MASFFTAPVDLKGGDEIVTELLYYTSEEVAGFLRISERTLKNRAEQGEIPGAVKIGSQWRFDKEKLEVLLGRKLPPPKGGSTA